ncbi:MAG: hypothetical protein M3Q50_02740 [Chloroflexota bacterium]|nr:hypothetical protein [Chloroflexota bacterium]
MEPENNDRLREPLDDEERELMDPDTWDWDSLTELPPVPNAGAVMAVHVTREEVAHVSQAARVAGQTTAGYIKQSALMRVMYNGPN